jgi:glycerate-2-kinase
LQRAYERASPSLRRPLFVVAAGKAAWPMAHALAAIDGDAIRAGLIAGPRAGSVQLPGRFESFEAGHPAANAASVAAAMRALELARAASEEDAALVVLLSGGASALLAAPVQGVTLAEKVGASRALMRAGIAIDGLNCVRKHLSRIKGGQLAATAARSMTFAISDVHGPIPDDPSVIGSGPTVADPTTFDDALAILRGVDGIPESVREHLERGARGEVAETVKPGDERLARAAYEIIATRTLALEGAAQLATALGYAVFVMDEPIEGEARKAAPDFLIRARRLASQSPGRACVLAAGETTVTVRGDGLGGRNQEFALSLVPEMAGIANSVRTSLVASAGTDGIDGPTDAAGAIVDSTTLERARHAGLDWESTLAANDAYHFFQPLGDLVMWGPTGTNVGDVQMLLVG